jgi:ribosomal protein S18 acetylase RimI-like enzyme
VNELVLRRAAAADAAAVRALTREAYARWVPLIGREPKPMQADYERAVEAHRVDLALLNGELVGLIETIDHPDHLLIENVAVAPAFQGRGLGKRLMAHAEQVAAEHDHSELRLYTNARFVENVALYRHLGYRVDREEKGPLGVTVYMSKRLSECLA